MSKLFGVFYENDYTCKTLMVGTHEECETFMSENSFYADFAYIEELENDYV